MAEAWPELPDPRPVGTVPLPPFFDALPDSDELEAREASPAPAVTVTPEVSPRLGSAPGAIALVVGDPLVVDAGLPAAEPSATAASRSRAAEPSRTGERVGPDLPVREPMPRIDLRASSGGVAAGASGEVPGSGYALLILVTTLAAAGARGLLRPLGTRRLPVVVLLPLERPD